MSDTKTLRWPGTPLDGRYGGGTALNQNGWTATEGYCLAEVSDPPWYISTRQCSKKAVVDGLCRQHAKQRDRWLKMMGG